MQFIYIQAYQNIIARRKKIKSGNLWHATLENLLPLQYFIIQFYFYHLIHDCTLGGTQTRHFDGKIL